MPNKPEELCVSFETAKALHDAGIVVESYFRYAVFGSWKRYEVMLETEKYPTQWYPKAPSKIAVYPAPTVEELLSLLPDRVEINGVTWLLHLQKKGDNLDIYYHHTIYKGDGISESIFLGGKPKTHDKLCEAFADNVIRLKEAGYELV